MKVAHVTTVDTFVDWEERQAEKHEFADGAISLLPGGTLRHATIALNVCLAIRGAVGPGRVFGSDGMVTTTSSCRYPDVSVSLDPRDSPEQRRSRYPTLIVEVVSPSTAAVDRGEKLDEYRTIETLCEYVLVDSARRWVQVIRRAGDDWIVALPLRAGVVAFESVGLAVTFDEIYAGTDL